MKNLSLNFLPNQNFPCPQNHPRIKDIVFSAIAELILGNNICWDQALTHQVPHYLGTVPSPADKNSREIASAVNLEPSKVTFTHHGTTYEIIACENIGQHLDSHMADLIWA